MYRIFTHIYHTFQAIHVSCFFFHSPSAKSATAQFNSCFHSYTPENEQPQRKKSRQKRKPSSIHPPLFWFNMLIFHPWPFCENVTFFGNGEFIRDSFNGWTGDLHLRGQNTSRRLGHHHHGVVTNRGTAGCRKSHHHLHQWWPMQCPEDRRSYVMEIYGYPPQCHPPKRNKVLLRDY